LFARLKNKELYGSENQIGLYDSGFQEEIAAYCFLVAGAVECACLDAFH
jgi:hypothetical protein